MKRFFLLSLLAVGCAHAPAAPPRVDGDLSCFGAPCSSFVPREAVLDVAKTESAALTDSVRIIREAVRAELLGVANRPASEFTLALKLYGAPKYLGVIDYTGTSKTNHEATTPFSNTGDALCGKTLLVHATTAAHVLPVSTNTGTVTTATGVPMLPSDKAIITMMASTSGTECWLAVIRSTASGNLSVWELR